MIKKNWFFILLFIGILLVFAKRYSYLSVPVVSNPDSQVVVSTKDSELEQTWQPEIKMISGVRVPYQTEDDFSCDAVLTIFNDDYSKVIAEAAKENVVFQSGDAGELSFDFGRKKVAQGERLRIRLSLRNASGDGILQIASGSNYGGCSIAGESCGQAAALQITFVKYSRFFWLAAICFPLFAFSLLAMVLTGRKWEETVALSMFVEGIILYLFGLIEHLTWGLAVVYLLALAALLLAVYFYNRKDFKLRSLLSPGLWLYLALFCVILLTSYGDWLGNRDELRHWGIAVRDMFYYDSFAKHANSTLILPRYLPFAALMEYAFEYMNGLFKEDILFIAYQVMLLNVLIILSKPLSKEGGKKLLLPVLSAMICIPVIFFPNLSSSILVDSLMAMLIAYALICHYLEEISCFNCIRIACAMVVMALTKEIGLVLAGVTALIIFGDIAFGQIRKKKINLKELSYPILCVCLVLAAYFSWQIYLNTPTKSSPQVIETAEVAAASDTVVKAAEQEEITVASAISASGITLEGLKNVLTGKGEGYQYQTTKNMIIELLDGETYQIGPLKLSFVDLLVMIAFFTASMGYLGFLQEEKERAYVFAGMILAAGACFCAFLQITYWFSFSMYEAMELTSIDRYLAPYLCGVAITVFFLVYDRISYDYIVFLITVILIICMPVKDLVMESRSLPENTTRENTYGYGEITEMLRSVADKGERVYFICSKSDGYAEYIFRNRVCPIVSEHENWNIVPNEEVYRQQFEFYKEGEITVNNAAKIMSPDHWKGELSWCKYVVVFHADELFKQAYGDLFAEKEIPDGSVYQVIGGQGDISLQLMGITEIQGFH